MDALATTEPAAAPALADPGERLAAAAVDAGLVAVAAAPFLLIGPRAAAGAAVAIAFAYLTASVARFGQTLGHALFGAAAVDEASASRPTPMTAAIRAAVLVAPAALAVAGPTVPAAILAALIGAAAAIDEQVRGLHDRAARTIVLRAERVAPPGVAALACAAATIVGVATLAAGSLAGPQPNEIAGFPGCTPVPSDLVSRIEAILQGEGSRLLLPRRVTANARQYIVATGDIRRPGQPVQMFVRFTVRGETIGAYDDDTGSVSSAPIDVDAAASVPGRQALSTATACHLDATLRRSRRPAP